MVTKVEANSPELRALVERTRQGEEVLITLDGKPQSRVTAAGNGDLDRRPAEVVDWAARVRELEAHLDDGVIGHSGPDIQTIIDELREERI